MVAGKLAALFCLILGAKIWLLRTNGTPLPFFDQWEGEGQEIIQRSLRGTLHWREFVAPFVQHRILWTRLLVWGLYRLNGQWDTQVEGIAAAVVHGACAVALGAVLIRRLGRGCEDPVLLGLAVLFTLPFGWENALSGGFASQYYFLILFSVVAMWGLSSHPAGAGAWWTGVAAAVMAWFSMGSGGVASFAVGGWILVRWRQQGRLTREQGVTLAVSILLGVVGTSLMIGASTTVDPLRPHSIGEFLDKFLGLLSWPTLTPPAAVAAYAPFGWFVWTRWRGAPRSASARADGFVCSLGIFCLLQTAAIAYARNHYRDLLVSRYMDVLSLGALVNFACLLLAARETRLAGTRAATIAGLAGAAWIVMTVLSLSGLTSHDLDQELPFIRAGNLREVANVTAFVAAPDPARLAGRNTFDYQCDNQHTIINLLMDPALRGVLPSPVRAPLPILPANQTGTVSQFAPSSGPAAAGNGWVVDPPAAAEVSTFRSQTMQTPLAYLDFLASGRVDAGARLSLVGERTGRSFPLTPDAAKGRWWSVRVAAPGEPFHLEIALPGGAPGPLVVLAPREVGRLSAWVETVFSASYLLLFGGAALWSGISFYQRQRRDDDAPTVWPLPTFGAVPEMEGRAAASR